MHLRSISTFMTSSFFIAIQGLNNGWNILGFVLRWLSRYCNEVYIDFNVFKIFLKDFLVFYRYISFGKWGDALFFLKESRIQKLVETCVCNDDICLLIFLPVERQVQTIQSSYIHLMSLVIFKNNYAFQLSLGLQWESESQYESDSLTTTRSMSYGGSYIFSLPK